jgi:hypothetical protein
MESEFTGNLLFGLRELLVPAFRVEKFFAGEDFIMFLFFLLFGKVKTGCEGVAKLDHASPHFHFFGVFDFDIFGYLDDGLFFIKRKLGLIFGIICEIGLLVQRLKIIVFEDSALGNELLCSSGSLFGVVR